MECAGAVVRGEGRGVAGLLVGLELRERVVEIGAVLRDDGAIGLYGRGQGRLRCRVVHHRRCQQRGSRSKDGSVFHD